MCSNARGGIIMCEQGQLWLVLHLEELNLDYVRWYKLLEINKEEACFFILWDKVSSIPAQMKVPD